MVLEYLKGTNMTATKRCPRCKGRKIIYKVGSAYCMVNSGGKEVDCPFCLGDGKVDVTPKSNKEDKADANEKTKGKKRGPKAKSKESKSRTAHAL